MIGETEQQEEPSREDRLISILERQKQDLVVRFLKKHEEAQANRSFLDKIMSNLPDLIIVLSADFRIVQASSEFHEALGYPPDKLPLSLQDITGKDNFRILTNRFAAGEFRDLETTLLTHQGTPLPVSIRGTTYTTDNGRTLYLLIASDRRDFYEVMNRMREVQDQLIHSGRLASLGEMAAGIGHELTQPLNTVLLLARNCLKALDDPRSNEALLRDNLATIINRTNHASAIIHSLRGFASKVKEDVAPVRVNVAIIDVLGFLDAQVHFADIELQLDMADRDFWVLAQEVRLEQVLLNLIQNAIQAMAMTQRPRLSIAVTSALGVDPTSLQQKQFVEIAITDNGEGIPADVRDKIFDPFFTTREVGSGMGLGLSIVERIVRNFDGHIKVHSIPGQETTFTVLIPECSSPSRTAEGIP